MIPQGQFRTPGVRGGPALLWDRAEDPVGKGFGTELMPSGGWAGGRGMCWKVLAGRGATACAFCHCHCSTVTAAATGLQSASIQLGMAELGCHCILHLMRRVS